MDGNSVRDEVRDAIRDELAVCCPMDIEDIDADMVSGIADAVFDALGMDEQDQNRTREGGRFVWLQAIHKSIEAGGGDIE